MDERKPLARLERRDIQRTVRFSETEDKALQEGAGADHVDFSSYVRECVMDGHTMKQARRLVKRAGA